MTRRWRTGAALAALVGLISACSAPGPAGGTGAAASTTSIQNSCINPTEIAKQDIVSDKEIRFTLRNGEVWVNQLRYACSGLKSEDGFEWEVRGTLVCSNQQTIKVLKVGTPCQLGAFTKLPKAQRRPT